MTENGINNARQYFNGSKQDRYTHPGDFGNRVLSFCLKYRAMSYEPWHVEAVETRGMSWAAKKTEYYEYMGGGYYPMDVKSFQMIVGLKPDGIAGKNTLTKAQEVLECIGPVLLKTDGNKIHVNGYTGNIQAIAFAGTTYGAVRPIAEALGREVSWDEKTKVITIK